MKISKMKSITALTVILLSVLFVGLKSDTTAVQEEGINFAHIDFKEAKALAKKENKLIFIDAYTTWCGPCKRMARTVFKEKAVGDYYNEHFVNLKIDMETAQGLFIGKKYTVQYYPTYLFIKPDGTLVKKAGGATKSSTFIGFGKSAIKG
ncbi:MAG: thioredoxin-related protein [Bacteroidia bacterium]|jgi:thioredoxin-related protein